ncbi:uncharacterized protein EURHEDRAFT_225234 [Aspergillus ruber CBS 135680]|uniref:Uncharacterized protein n=1 Tax=Aspergillus ruber (strain CBS 135680) TaxID=1388766 RepID=A0A017S4L7_ASPRC|nr:uncharacterized protein EURHEDRAFT_225234 [Aspergillus ruber CBS 135680]EYE91973.1 hypothetical protein EURHEDRAFT_225234 [Aspergillus ruber CBS 135680]
MTCPRGFQPTDHSGSGPDRLGCSSDKYAWTVAPRHPNNVPMVSFLFLECLSCEWQATPDLIMLLLAPSGSTDAQTWGSGVSICARTLFICVAYGVLREIRVKMICAVWHGPCDIDKLRRLETGCLVIAGGWVMMGNDAMRRDSTFAICQRASGYILFPIDVWLPDLLGLVYIG